MTAHGRAWHLRALAAVLQRCLAAAVLLSVAAAAHGGTLSLSGNLLTYTASSGMANVVTANSSGGTLTITDSGETITLDSSIPSGWSGGGTNTVGGSESGINALDLELADGDDSIGASSVDLIEIILRKTSGKLTFTGATSVTGSNGVIDIHTSGDVALSSAISAPSEVLLTGGGAVNGSGGTSADVTSGALEVFAQTGISLNVDVSHLQFANFTTSGAVTIASGSTTHDLYVDDDFFGVGSHSNNHGTTTTLSSSHTAVIFGASAGSTDVTTSNGALSVSAQGGITAYDTLKSNTADITLMD